MNRFGILADWIVDHRGLTLVLLIAATVLAGIGQYDPYLLLPEPKVEREVTEDDPFDSGPSSPMPDVSPVRVESGDVIVVARSDAFFTPDGAEAIRSVVDALESLDQVDSIFWMDRAPMLNIFGLPEPVLPRRNASTARFQSARQRALDHPLIRGQLLSPDARSLLLMVNIDWLYVMEDRECTDVLRETAEKAAAAFPGVAMSFGVTGDVPIRLSHAASNRANELKYQAIGYSMALAIASILFRGLSSVMIVALAPTFGVFWTMGLLHYLGLDDNPFNSVIVPVLLCMVGFTDGVHMMVQIRRHRSSGLSPTDAARTAIREVGLACWLTSLTTAIGFGSLALARHEIVREFGYCCVIGVLTTFIAVITIIPLACSSRLGNRVHAGYGRNLVDQNLSRISVVIDYVLARAGRFSILAMTATIALGFLTFQLRPDERLTSALNAGDEAVVALAHIDREFGGMETARVMVRWHPDIESDAPEVGSVVAQVDDALRKEELIGHPISIRNLIDALPGEGEVSTRMSLLELLPPPLKRAYYVPEQRYAQVRFRVQDIGIASYGPVFERMERRIAEIQDRHPGFRIELDGGAVWRWRNLYQIVIDLAYSLGTASVIIFGVLTVVFRSLRLGLISIVPNMFPLAATGCLLLITGQHLEIVSVCAFTVCLGIAVDDTIHFLTRYQEEQKRAFDVTPIGDPSHSVAANGRSIGNDAGAIRRAFIGVGTALIMTTIVLMIGFSTALLSDARDHRIFAMMGILTIGSALFADLLFLPALLLRYDNSRSPKPRIEPS